MSAARLAPRDAVVLLPGPLTTCSVATTSPGWDGALRAWGATPVARDADVVVLDGSEPVPPSAKTAILLGPLRRRARRSLVQGWEVASYGLRAAGDGITAVPGARRATLHVAGREGVLPAALVAAGRSELDLALVPDDRRRRAALFTADAVAKVERDPASAHRRGQAEQAVLARLRDAGVRDGVPLPLGDGVVGTLAWSAESRATGHALHRATSVEVLDRVAGVLSEIATATATHRAGPPTTDDVLPLRGEARDLESALTGLADVPAVLAHGDLATGHNVLVDGRRVTLIDWETARPGGLPLLDLVPLLCLGSARAAGCSTVEDQAAHVLALCRGELEGSVWLFEHVRTQLDRLGVPLERAGILASLAWGAQASMRLVYLELVPGAEDWSTAEDTVAAAWRDDARLGVTWSAFAEHGRRR